MFILNILLVEFGAADFSGSGAALGAITRIGPVVTVLVVAGAGATAMCADLGARTVAGSAAASDGGCRIRPNHRLPDPLRDGEAFPGTGVLPMHLDLHHLPSIARPAIITGTHH